MQLTPWNTHIMCITVLVNLYLCVSLIHVRLLQKVYVKNMHKYEGWQISVSTETNLSNCAKTKIWCLITIKILHTSIWYSENIKSFVNKIWKTVAKILLNFLCTKKRVQTCTTKKILTMFKIVFSTRVTHSLNHPGGVMI